MRAAVLGLAAGVLWLQQQALLPPGWMLAGLALFGLGGAVLILRLKGPARILACALLGAAVGIAWSGMRAQLRMSESLDASWEGREVQLVGVVASLPQPLDGGTRFEFDVEHAQPPEARVPSHLQLTWYDGLSSEEFQEVVPLQPGERWRFTARLRRPHGLANPHGFDYEAWLLERGIRATGTVNTLEAERLDSRVRQPAYLLERLRGLLRERFWDVLPQSPHAGVLVALAIGEQRAIDSRQWQLFARTGVSHLMSISGLHVTMIAGLAAWIASFLWRRSERLMLFIPAQRIAALAGFLGALAYCLISGFAVPAQRTLYMVGVVGAALWLDRVSVPSRVLALALALVLLVDPWAVLEAGFWLSFGAVGIIFYIATARPVPAGWLLQWGRVQWGITVGLVPLMMLLFRQVSLVSPLANALAIPVVSFLVTPLAIAGAVLPFDFLLHVADAVMGALMPCLEWLSGLDAAVWQQHAPALWSIALALVGTLWLLAPRGFPARSLGLVLMLPMFMILPPGPAPGAAWITFLDVGQGMAAAVRTERHTLIYDAGPAWGSRRPGGADSASDSGLRVVLPYLRGEGIERLDAVVISHDDSDHSGGAASVLRGLPAAMLLSSLDRDHPAQALAPVRLPCRAGQSWNWDGVRFSLLHPTERQYADPGATTNDRSCVLKIEAGASALLAGDVGRFAEEALLQEPGTLRVDTLLVPHHGSATSSSPAFVQAVSARHAVFSVGYRNRFGHPRQEILDRYAAAGASIERTDRDGAVMLRLDATGASIGAFRQAQPRYWNHHDIDTVR